jgi:lipid-binding SYLF domain-containing protein
MRLLAGLALLFFALGTTSLHAQDNRQVIVQNVNATLKRLYQQVPGTYDLGARAQGILVFPSIVKAGFGIGGEYGEGALSIQGKFAGYYNIASASVGFQLGAQERSVVIMFMTPQAFANFQRVDGFSVGVDGSVAIITVGAGAGLDTKNITSPIVGFVVDPKGLMYNLTLEGTKISRMR